MWNACKGLTRIMIVPLIPPPVADKIYTFREINTSLPLEKAVERGWGGTHTWPQSAPEVHPFPSSG